MHKSELQMVINKIMLFSSGLHLCGYVLYKKKKNMTSVPLRTQQSIFAAVWAVSRVSHLLQSWSENCSPVRVSLEQSKQTPPLSGVLRSFITSLKTYVYTLGDCEARWWSAPKRSSSPTNTDSCEWPQRLGGLRWRARLFTDARVKVNSTPDQGSTAALETEMDVCLVWKGDRPGVSCSLSLALSLSRSYREASVQFVH